MWCARVSNTSEHACLLSLTLAEGTCQSCISPWEYPIKATPLVFSPLWEHRHNKQTTYRPGKKMTTRLVYVHARCLCEHVADPTGSHQCYPI